MFFLKSFRLFFFSVFLILQTSCGQKSAPLGPNFTGQIVIPSTSRITEHSPKLSNLSNPELPDYVLKVWTYVRTHHKSPEGFVGGRIFGNFEHRLPIKDQNGITIHYEEWDLHPHQKKHNRGAERLITSDLGKAYYTSDHYQTFIEIKADQ